MHSCDCSRQIASPTIRRLQILCNVSNLSGPNSRLASAAAICTHSNSLPPTCHVVRAHKTAPFSTVYFVIHDNSTAFHLRVVARVPVRATTMCDPLIAWATMPSFTIWCGVVLCLWHVFPLPVRCSDRARRYVPPILIDVVHEHVIKKIQYIL